MNNTPPCYCITCHDEWARVHEPSGSRILGDALVRFACEVCGNKRCPHHTDHRLACTNSNEPGQPGSIY